MSEKLTALGVEKMMLGSGIIGAGPADKLAEVIEDVFPKIYGTLANSMTEGMLEFLAEGGKFAINEDSSIPGSMRPKSFNIINEYFPPAANQYGTYGMFFEKALFNLDRNFRPGADFDIGGLLLELKTTINDGLTRTRYFGHKKKVEVKNYLTVGGVGSSKELEAYKGLVERAKKAPGTVKPDEIAAAFAKMGSSKFFEKMENLLFSKVEAWGTQGGKRRWGKRGSFVYTKLLLYYGLIRENVMKILVESISVKADVATSEFINKNKGTYTVKISMEYIAPYQALDEWMKNEDRIYRVRVDLFNNLDEAQKFFEGVLNFARARRG